MYRSSWKFVVLATLEDRQMEIGEAFTESIFICCGCALLSKYLSWFLIIWTLNYSFAHAGDHCWKPPGTREQGNKPLVILRSQTGYMAYCFCFWQERASCGSNNDQRLRLYRLYTDYTDCPMVTRLSIIWLNQLAALDSSCSLWGQEVYSSMASEGDSEQDSNLRGLNCLWKVTLP